MISYLDAIRKSILLSVFISITPALLAQQGNMVSFFATQNIYEIAEEGNYLWLSTYGGLLKFDKTSGKVVESYNSGNSPIPENRLYGIAIDKQGNKWIGCGRGIIKLTGNSCEYIPSTEMGLTSYAIESLAVDTAGNIWACNLLGVAINDGTGWKRYDDAAIGFSLMGVEKIVADKHGNVWFAYGAYYIAKYDGQQWTRYSDTDIGIDELILPRLAVDDDGMMWLIDDYSLYKFNGIEWLHIPYTGGSISTNYSIDCGPGNSVWCCYANGAISVYNGSEWTYYYSDYIPDYANYILASDNGITWIATNEGLLKLENGLWSKYNPSEVTFLYNHIIDIEIGNDGKKWIVDMNLNSYDGKWENHPVSDLLTKAKFDLEGNLWLGSHLGVDIHDSLYYEDTLHGEQINDIAVSPEGNLCFATGFIFGGLYFFENPTWTAYNSQNSLIDGEVNCAMYDEYGTLWFSDGKGLHTFDGFTWNTYSTDNSEIPFNSIFSIAFDKDGVKYFGSMRRGLARFDGTNWTVFNKSNSPLPDDWLTCLKFDNDGNLWIGTDKSGIFYTNGTDWWTINMANSSLPCNHIRDIEMEGNIKWIATASGLASYDGTGELLSKGEPVEMHEVTIYPNPASETIRIDLPSSCDYNISIINLQGQLMQSSSGSNTTLNISSLPPGFYCIQASSEAGSYVGKFVKK